MIDASNCYGDIDKCSGKFWNCKKLLTFNRPLNFVTGSRSVGKSTGIGIFFILDFLKNGHKFIYTRRTIDETKLTCKSFFNSAVSIINKHTKHKIVYIRYDRLKYFIKYIDENGEEVEKHCGDIIPLNRNAKMKSSNYEEYCNLVFDEFICQDASMYLGTKSNPFVEPDAIQDLYVTIDRGIDRPFRNETRFFFLGNTSTIYNPFFLKYNVTRYIVEGARYIRPKNDIWVLERVESVEATKEYKDSFAYKMMDEGQRDYAFKNKGSDNDKYIKKLPDIRFYQCTLVFGGEEYGVWTDKDYRYYIGKAQKHGYTYSLDITSHSENDLQLVTRWKEIPVVNILVEKFKKNKTFFCDGKCKQIFIRYFNLMP